MTKTNAQLLADRARLLGPNVSTFYDNPIHMVKGEGVWVWDANGRQYLDCYNNVPHVGHCHPKVVQAICQQAGTLNTHTRYLHEGIVRYVEKLTNTFAEPLNTAIMTCTGSEANDIALRMAEAMTGKRGIIATDHTYHGNTTMVAKLSNTNKSDFGGESHVRFVPAPDSYRPAYWLDGGLPEGMSHDQAFAEQVKLKIKELEATEHGFAGMIICPFFANEGFPSLESGFLDEAVAAIKAAGGIVIADEVQPGFGRIGTHMWGHQRVGILPDVVTLGKPMGNGHPVGGVVTSMEVMTQFREAFRYFNTFGGNPVSCAAAEAVLDVMVEEGLMEQAKDVGDYARAGLQALADKHVCIGDVRGSGMFFGAEMVVDRATKQPATAFTKRVANAMREEGVILNFLGINYNALKIRPNLQFEKQHADLMLDTLDRVLSKVELRP